VVLRWPRAYVVHVGDSRAYYLRGGRLRQLTRDQTAYDHLVDEGLIKEDPPDQTGRRHMLRDVLTSAVGSEIEPTIGLIDLEPDDVLLLCTDGLTKHVPDSDITEILGAGASAETTCSRLLDLTLERGARDNVTMIVGRFAAS
jgi:protein phosphatase